MDDVVQTERSEKSVSSDLIRGHINTIILRALYDGDKYGYEIIAEIERKSHGQYSLKQPSLYSALKRLEKDGYVTSYWGGSVSGGRRKYFSLTESGKAISEQNQSEWEYSRTVIDSLISDKDFDFSNPAPTHVDMRVLKKSTSRVPRSEGEDDELDYLPSFDDDAELDQIEESYQEKLSEQRAAFDEEMRTSTEELTKEFDWREQELAAREKTLSEQRAALDAEREQAVKAQEEREQQLSLREKQAEDKLAASEAASQEQAQRAQDLASREQQLTESLARNETLAKENDWREQELAAREKALSEQRAALDAEREQAVKAQEEREQQLSLREKQAEDKLAASEAASQEQAQRAQDLASREQQLTESLARNETLAKEFAWREQELAARENSLSARNAALDAKSEETVKQQDARESELAMREQALEEQRIALEEQAASRLAEQQTQLEAHTLQALADQRAEFEEEMRTRSEALTKERDWREQEIAEREQALLQKRSELDARNATLLKEYDWREREISARELALSQRRSDIEVHNQSVAKDYERREQEIQAREQALADQRAELEAQNEREATEQEEALRMQIESLEYQLKENEAALEEAQRLAEERLINQEAEEQRAQIASLEEERDSLLQQIEEQKKTAEDQLEEERKKAEALLEDEKKKSEALLADERQRNEFLLETERHRSEAAIAAERNNYNNHLESVLAQERAKHEAELKEQEERIIAEQTELFRRQEHAIMQRSYLELLSSPRVNQQSRGEYNHYNAPAPAQADPPAGEDYRSVVHRLYANAVAPEQNAAPEPGARSLDGIDFTDLQSRAEKDGIRIQTSGGKPGRFEQETESLVNKGKALFLSGVAFCAFCFALGCILLGISASFTLPAFYPYLLWGVGFAVLLITGLAFANHYGARSLRKTGPVILNSVIAYILLVIVTLILALAVRVDFNSTAALTAWVTIPIIAYLGIILFAVVYYIQIRPKKD